MCHMHVDWKNDSMFSQADVLLMVVWDDSTSGNSGTNGNSNSRSGTSSRNGSGSSTNGSDSDSGTNGSDGASINDKDNDEFVSSGHRLSIIMYTRQSICNYLIQQNVTMGPALNKIVEVFGQIRQKELYRMDPHALIEYVKR